MLFNSANWDIYHLYPVDICTFSLRDTEDFCARNCTENLILNLFLKLHLWFVVPEVYLVYLRSRMSAPAPQLWPPHSPLSSHRMHPSKQLNGVFPSSDLPWPSCGSVCSCLVLAIFGHIRYIYFSYTISQQFRDKLNSMI